MATAGRSSRSRPLGAGAAVAAAAGGPRWTGSRAGSRNRHLCAAAGGAARGWALERFEAGRWGPAAAAVAGR